MKARWQAAHGIASLAACNTAFEDCKEEDRYDLSATTFHIIYSFAHQKVGAAWQLVSLSEWVLRFMENLARECILFDGVIQLPPSDEADDLFGPGPRECFLLVIGVCSSVS